MTSGLSRLNRRNTFNLLSAALCHFTFAYFVLSALTLLNTNELIVFLAIDSFLRLRVVIYADQLVFFCHQLVIKLKFFSFRAVLFWHFRSAGMFRFEDRRQKLKGFF